MKSIRLLLIAAALAVAAMVTTAGGVTGTGARSLRWDFADVRNNETLLLPSGSSMSKDAATGDTLTLTGSGQFTPTRRLVSGGGSFVHKHADGTTFAQGYYYATAFRSWRPGGGKLPKVVTNRIVSRTQGQVLDGILRMTVKLVPVVDGKPGAANTATLSVLCALPHNRLGLKEEDNGFDLSAGTLHFKHVPMGGDGIFHRLR
jgi:hypothetical protein